MIYVTSFRGLCHIYDTTTNDSCVMTTGLLGLIYNSAYLSLFRKNDIEFLSFFLSLVLKTESKVGKGIAIFRSLSALLISNTSISSLSRESK